MHKHLDPLRIIPIRCEADLTARAYEDTFFYIAVF